MIELTGYIIPFVIACITCLVLIALSIVYWRAIGSSILTWIFSVVFVWMAAEALLQYATDEALMKLCLHVSGFSMGLLAPLWLAFTYSYVGMRLRMSKPAIAAGCAYVALYIIRYLNPADLFLVSIGFSKIGNRAYIELEYGVIYYLIVLAFGGFMLWSIIIAVKAHRRFIISQSTLLLFLLATVLPVLVGSFYVMRILPLDLTPILYTSSCGILAWMAYGLEFSEVLAGIRGIGSAIKSGIILVDQNGLIREMNHFASEMLQLKAFECYGKPLSALLNIPEAFEALNTTMEVEIERKEGSDKSAVRLYVSEVSALNGKAQGKLVFMDDIGKIKQAESRLIFASNFDMVTGLPNRFRFMCKLDDALKNIDDDETFCVLMIINIIGFGRINEEYGYGEGDNVLRAFADRLRKLVPGDELLCRFSADVFHVLLTDLYDPEGAVRSLANAVVGALNAPFAIGEKNEKLAVNIGAALAPTDGTTVDQLLASANIALSHSSELPENTLALYSDEITQRLLEKERLLEEMKLGLREGCFEVIYQPQLDLEQRDVFGVEALVRWNHPERGLISPAVFIPLAEESGFIKHLGMFVMEQSCKQIARWRRDGFVNIKMSVNISIVQLYDEEFMDKVFELVYRYSIPLAFLELEITESIALDERKAVQKNVQRLRESGFPIAIDDFGMGHSTLMYLTHFPVHTLKLDSALVRYVQRNHNAAVIVKAIAMICENMGIELIAEGVETAELCDAMQKIGCHLFQGYLFSRPLSVSDCARFFRNGPLIWNS